MEDNKKSKNKVLGESIKKVISRHGLSVKEVAERMGMKNISGLSMTIYGNPTYQRLCEIASAIGCTPSELIADENEIISTTVVCPKCGAKLNVSINAETQE